jgi:hypothetical protein
MCELDTTESGQGPVAGPRECGYKHSGTMKGREYTNKFSN